MKKLILLLIGFSVLTACGPGKKVQEAQKTIKGEWLMETVTYSESGTYNITLFDDASQDCFEGSTWRFIPNNNTGHYTINSAGCPVGKRDFIFTIQEVDAVTGYYDFLLKPAGQRSKSVETGYRLRLAHLSDTNMRWEMSTSVDGKPFNIYLNFSKIN